MKVLVNRNFSDSIVNNLNMIPNSAKKDLELLKSLFPKETYIVGGFVRDSLLKKICGYDFPINDLDIVIDSANFHKKIVNFQNENRSSLGSLKLKYNDFSTDIMCLHDVYFLGNSKNKSIENFLEGVDFSTSALAYNLSENKIYDSGALESINKKEINVIGNSLMKSAPTITRLILHSDKMDFKIGERGLQYVKENYSKNLDSEIKDWLDYKEIPHLFPFVKNKINSILK